MTQKYFKLEFRFQVSNISEDQDQDRKTNLSFRFLGEFMAWQFCLETHWPLHYYIMRKKYFWTWHLFSANYGNQIWAFF